MIIPRDVLKLLKNDLGKQKALLITGARHVGMTTLLRALSANWDNTLWLTGDELETRKMFENPTIVRLSAELSGVKFLMIDEAQRLPNIGLCLKLITDHLRHIQLILTGSSDFELCNQPDESLTERMLEYQLYPLSFSEMADYQTLRKERQLMYYRLIYGYYPDVVKHPKDAKKILQNLIQHYLYKDMLLLEEVRKPDKIEKLLQALAYQVGSRISYNELSNIVGMNIATVEKYITMLEQSFVLFRLNSFSRNLRSELSKSRKIYFYDNGIRNALIGNFSAIEVRTDADALWENFLVSERLKLLHNNERWVQRYFWRTREHQEVDYLEEEDGILRAFDFTWSKTKKKTVSKTFSRAYPNAEIAIITPENSESFIILQK